jgi:hypothetical protein
MTQARGALPTPTVLDYERTLILAIELSNTSWVLAVYCGPVLRHNRALRRLIPDCLTGCAPAQPVRLSCS